MDWFAQISNILNSLMVNADPIEIIWVILTGSALWQLWSKYPRMKGNIAYQQETALRDKSKPLARARINQAKSRFISRQISLVAVFIMFFLGIVALINPNASGPSVAKTIYAVVFIFLANFINNRASEVNDLWDRIDDDINDHIAGLTVNGVVKVAKVENSGTA